MQIEKCPINLLTYKALYAYRQRCTYSTTLFGPMQCLVVPYVGLS